jgi:hypothetical protein
MTVWGWGMEMVARSRRGRSADERSQQLQRAGGTITHWLDHFSTAVDSGSTVNLTLICRDGTVGHGAGIGPGQYNDFCTNGAPYKRYCGRSPACATRQN